MSEVASNLVALADAVVARINAMPAEYFPTAVSAERILSRVVDVADLKAGDPPLVLVYPAVTKQSRAGGGRSPVFISKPGVVLRVMGRVGVGAAADAACEQDMLLLELLAECCKGVCLSVAGIKDSQAVLEEVEGDPAFYDEYLTNDHCFVADLKLTFAGVA